MALLAEELQPGTSTDSALLHLKLMKQWVVTEGPERLLEVKPQVSALLPHLPHLTTSSLNLTKPHYVLTKPH